MEQRFELIHRTSFQQFCTDFIFKSPDKIFKSLIYIGCLQMKEIKVWEHVLKWGLVQNQTLISDPDTWIDEIFKMMGNNLQNCIPLIRFFSLSSKEFLHEVSLHNKIFEPSAL
uniref:Uncharacterized protein n=1 Tax=Rhizophagus irregularis (strain DAOM 181602 / DAOM 197198 / MUCL 43194) TaxID=747089 RepID=U9SRL1_RHIID